MALPNTAQILRDSARGGQNYKASRYKLAASILTDPNLSVGSLNRFLIERFFKLDKKSWIVLEFGNKDWSILESLFNTENEAVHKAYLSLIGEYVLANASRVQDVYKVSSEISAEVIRDDGARITKSLEAFDEADWQSIFSFRVYAAQRSHSNDLLIDYFKKQMSTDWLRKRFLYPFVYYAINNTSDLHIDNFLSYVISGGVKNRSERETIKFLLCDEISSQPKASFKYYIGLLCHPFDACEILLNHLELEYVSKGALSQPEIGLLERLAGAIDARRVQSILRLVRRESVQFVTVPTGVLLKETFDLDDRHSKFLRDFTDTSFDATIDDRGLTRTFAQLARMRSTRYPQTDDFTAITTSASKWRFTDAGRLLNALLTSIFMVSRRERDYEIRMLTRFIAFSGELSAIIFLRSCTESASGLR